MNPTAEQKAEEKSTAPYNDQTIHNVDHNANGTNVPKYAVVETHAA